MAISESSLHPYIKGLVEENGKLTVTELNKMLREILTLDSDDLTILSGRKDDKFSQKKVVYTSISSWANEQFNNEVNGKSVEELKSMIANKKEETKGVIKYLATTEKTLLCDETYKGKCGGGNRANILSGEQNKMIDFYLEEEAREALLVRSMEKMDVGMQGIEFSDAKIEECPVIVSKIEVDKKGNLNVNECMDVDLSENKNDKAKTIKKEIREQRDEVEGRLVKDEEVIREASSHKGEPITDNARKVVKMFMKRDKDKSKKDEEMQSVKVDEFVDNAKVKTVKLSDLIKQQSQRQ
jgi:hypothetical protein